MNSDYIGISSNNLENVIVVGKGNINLDLGQQGTFTGVIIAPNGSVTFNGKYFKRGSYCEKWFLCSR